MGFFLQGNAGAEVGGWELPALPGVGSVGCRGKSDSDECVQGDRYDDISVNEIDQIDEVI